MSKLYSFDAHVCIEAESEEAAVSAILGHCIGRPAHIAISLHKEGTLNKNMMTQHSAAICPYCNAHDPALCENPMCSEGYIMGADDG